jgi:hypothetical protein
VLRGHKVPDDFASKAHLVDRVICDFRQIEPCTGCITLTRIRVSPLGKRCKS